MSDLTPVGLLCNQFGNLSIYYIWNIQASNFPLVPYLKVFVTSQLEFKTWIILTKGVIYLGIFYPLILPPDILPPDWCIYI